MAEDIKYSTDGNKASIDTANNGHDVEKSSHHTPPAYHNERRRRSSYDNNEDDPFGDEEDSEVKYRTLTWWQAAAIMVAETISLGILSLPSVLAAIGLVPGVILIVGLGIIATYTGYTMYQFKRRYPGVHNLADVGMILLGPIGREVFGAAQVSDEWFAACLVPNSSQLESIMATSLETDAHETPQPFRRYLLTLPFRSFSWCSRWAAMS